MDISRREFLKTGLAALGFAALPGGFLFAAPPGWKRGGKPNLVLGVISDTHLQATPKGKPSGYAPHKYFTTAFEYFRKANVDAVLHLGDMANVGQVEAMQFHADIWRKVFGKDGPAKLFVTGNHDFMGGDILDYAKRNYPNPEVRARKLFVTDMAGNWERIWGETYSDVWHKEVKGYHFFGRQWGVSEKTLSKLVNDCAKEYALDKSPMPSFILSHARLLTGFRNAVRPALKNAMILFGHCHMSATNWNTIYMYNEAVETIPSIQVPPCMGPPWGMNADGRNVAYIATGKLEGHGGGGKGRQGFVMRVYDDMLAIERLAFNDGVSSLGADWVMPFGKTPHPFSKGELKKVIGEPQFRKGAKLLVECCQCENVANSNTNSQLENGNIGIGNTGNIRVRIPLADGNPDSRVYAYDVVVAGDDPGKKLHKAVYAAGCNLGLGHEPNGGVTTLEIPYSELASLIHLPSSHLTIAARPLTSLGTSGKPIATEFKA